MDMDKNVSWISFRKRFKEIGKDWEAVSF